MLLDDDPGVDVGHLLVGAVNDHDHLEAGRRLLVERRERSGEDVPTVPRRDHDREVGCREGHGRAAGSSAGGPKYSSTVAGTPPTSVYAGTSRLTKELAATTAR